MAVDTATNKQAVIGARLMQRLEALAGCSDDGAVLTRLYLSPAHQRAVALVGGWMRDAGLAVTLDAAATLHGTRAGDTPDAPVLLLGSHLDTVRNAGRFDGALGVLAGLAAIELLDARGVRLPFALRLLGFGDEEGVRFPVTLSGSRALAGTLDIASQRAATDPDGIRLEQALRGFGCDPDRLHAARFAGEALGFLELHIEQGPVLERAGQPLGVVSAINGAARYRIRVDGEAGHAGTVPMRGRRDALAAAAEMMLEIRRIGLAEQDVTATVGHVAVSPGAVNVIPGQARFTLDLRAPLDPVRLRTAAAIEAALHRIAVAHAVDVAIERTHEAPAAPCDPALTALLRDACASVGVDAPSLPSGAGHDAMAMAALCPMAMLFVRCAGGVSHNPAETVEAGDALLAVRALAATIERMAGGEERQTGARRRRPAQTEPVAPRQARITSPG